MILQNRFERCTQYHWISFQGIAQTFSTAYHIIELRRKLMRITESAISWIKRRALNVAEIMVYLVEPSKAQDFVLRRIMTTDDKGFPIQLKDPAVRLERKDNLFRCDITAWQTHRIIVRNDFLPRGYLF